MTDGFEGVDASATGEASRGEAPTDLGVEGRAEYERLRCRLGLLDEHEAQADALPSLGRYRLERELGRGGMGVVYQAHDPELGRPVAVKLVAGLPFASTDALSSRLLREAQVLAKLTHPNVVRIYDVGSHEGEVYLAMEYVDGPTLREWQVGRTVEELLEAYGKAALGLAAAHKLEIVHRDFKPENVLVAQDARVLVGDFGLAGFGTLREKASLTQVEERPNEELNALLTKTGALLGTVAYMAPEQLRGDVATPKSDQFALCVSLWEALAGERPFLLGDGREELLASIERGVLPTCDRIPRDLRRLLQRGLAANPDDRYGDLLAFVDAMPGPRPRSVPLKGVWMLVGASLVLGLLGSWIAFGTLSTKASECDLEIAVTRVRGSDVLTELRDRLTEAEIHDGLREIDAFLGRIEERATDLCKPTPGPKSASERQHLLAWVEFLEALATGAQEGPTPWPVSQLVGGIEELTRARLAGPPPQPLAEDVFESLGQSKALMLSGDLPGALDAATRAVEQASDGFVDIAVAEQQRGRVLALSGFHDEAMNAYRAATSAADSAAYDDARLEVELLAARTAIMRNEDLARGRDALATVKGLFKRLGEQWWSLRRADFFELHAAVSKREGDYSGALTDQWQAVLLRTLFSGGIHETGRSYGNLGTIYERRGYPGDAALARLVFEHAVERLAPTKPSHEWAQAAFSLGHLLANSEAPSDDEPFADYERAEAILRDIRQRSEDLRRPALTELLLLAVRRDAVKEGGALAVALRDELVVHPPPSPTAGFDAWSAIATAAALAGDLTTLEGALAEANRFAALLESMGQSHDETMLQRVRLELTLASIRADFDDPRAKALARQAKGHLSSVPRQEHPEGMMQAIDELLLP